MVNVLFVLSKQKDIDDYRSLTIKNEDLRVDYAIADAASKWNSDWEGRVGRAEYVLLGMDIVGLWPEFTVALQGALRRTGGKVISLTSKRLDWESEISENQRRLFVGYFRYGGNANHNCLVEALSCMAKGDPLPMPVKMPWQGVFIPGQEPVSLRLYCQTHLTEMKQKTVLFLFHREQWLQNQTKVIEELCAETKRQGANPIALFCQFGAIETEKYQGVASVFSEIADGLPIDVVVTLQQQSMTGMPGFDSRVLMNASVPVLQAYTLYVTEEEWRANPDGMGAAELGTQVILPEFDGIIHTHPVAGVDGAELQKRSYLPVMERIRMVVKKAIGWAKLRHISSKKKKVAVILHNYPPKNSNIGSAAGLDTAESLYQLLCQMQRQGYDVGKLPESAEMLMQMVLAVATNDRAFLSESALELAQGKMSDGTYIQYYQTFAEKNKEELRQNWGAPPGEVLHFENYLLIPGIAFGNIWVGVQPPRGFGENLSAVYHSPTLPPTHQYLAFYEWVRSGWYADAVVHLGTHGSMEWLPGKGTGLSDTCYPDRALRDIPDIYPYWITIVGEGIQAKRRGSACLIGHMSPPQEEAGGYGEYIELSRLVDEYRTMFAQDGHTEEVKERIECLAKRLDFDLPDEMDDNDWIMNLHDRLEDLMYMQIRIGLHVLGHVPQGDELITYLSMLTNEENGKVPSLLYTFVMSLAGTDEKADDYRGRSRELRNRWLRWLLANKFTTTTSMQAEWVKKNQLSDDLVQKLQVIAVYIRNHIVPALQKTNMEIASILSALDGMYIEPSLGGAPTAGNADILPTGRNFTSADPRTFPTEGAVKVGGILADQALERFVKEEGRYPESIGIILWATSQMRTYGQCLAEIFALLGVKAVRQQSNGRITGLEIIPLAELGRPRIDVMARISGLFRDTMPTATHWIQCAVDMVSQLDESTKENYIRKHLQADTEFFERQGVAKETAWEWAAKRVFGDPPGAYGTGIGSVLETKNWETKNDLAEIYSNWSSYAVQEHGPAVHLKDAFALRLKTMEMTIQNGENRESHLLNSDDYNAYHGGLNAAVEAIRGKLPLALAGDSSRKNAIITRTVAEETERLIRGEALHPKFVEGMKKHGYKGAMELANYVAHLYQWDATSNVAKDWMYQRITETYAYDEAMKKWWAQVNPWAFKRLVETLLEAYQRGLWKASSEDVLRLQELLLTTEGELEETS